MGIESYRDLIVWRKSLALVVEVYLISARFPAAERFGLTSQLRRAATSVPANIAEGHGRTYRTEYRRFLMIAHGSLRETECLLDVAEALEFASAERLVASRVLCREIGRMLVVLMRRLAETKQG